MTLVLEGDTAARVRAHLVGAYPEEGCGVLLGHDGEGTRRVVDLVALDNRSPETRERRFTIAPEQFLAAEKHARARGLDVVGVFHSHPDHPAAPSAFDLEHAWPYYSYLIVSVRGGAVDGATSWRLAEDRSRFQSEPLEPAPALAREPSGESRA
jgi:proteasome lid subunit RPN8/RPN11